MRFLEIAKFDVIHSSMAEEGYPHTTDYQHINDITGNFYLAVAAFIFYEISRGLGYPIYTTWLTQNIDAKVPATVISMNGQMNALGQVAGGPPVGYIGMLSPVLLLLAYASRKLKKG